MKLKITIDGTQYEADLEVLEDEQQGHPATAARRAPPATRPSQERPVASPPPADLAAPGGNDDKVCRSSIVGIVVKVLCEPGQVVKVGEPLLVLEAMKMESNVVSPFAGAVKKVHVSAGGSVTRGQVLVEFE